MHLMNTMDFVKREGSGIPYYSCLALESVSGLRHGFSTRHGGIEHLSETSLNLGYVSWDNRKRVKENRQRFLAALNLESANLTALQQIHSDRFIIITESRNQENPPEGDALLTQIPGVALAVQMADCLPVLMVDPVNYAIAAIHAGWRGILTRIVQKAIHGMQKHFNADPDRILVAIGPGIRSCCFEVGAEVVRLFDEEYIGIQFGKPACDRPGKHLLDLRQALDIQFDAAGIMPHNVYDLRACTCCTRDEFFSFRSEGVRCGRMMSVIGWTQG
jgi:YfiH family protein